MVKREKIRFDIHKILFSIYKFNKTLNSPSNVSIFNNYKKEDISFLNNVILNSMRLNLHCSIIISRYLKKKLRLHEKILLISAITQIVFLDFKEYAVINCSVEIAKRLKIYPGLVNASLKNISKDKKKLKLTKIEYSDLPDWFKNNTNFLTKKEKKHFLKNFSQEPSIHIVFKNSKKLNLFEENIFKTSSVSGFLEKRKDITEIKSFKKGDWWVQDFSSFFPIQYLYNFNKNETIFDACAAPGGKSFQILSKNLKLISNDKSFYRRKIFESNLNRLNFKSEVLNNDFIKLNTNRKYDFIIIDAPCTAVGTIRKNPEIFFKNKSPDFKSLLDLQGKLLDKASFLLNKNGLILYMVCSFLEDETTGQINKFLLRHKNFEIYNLEKISKNLKYSKFLKKNFMLTLPDTIQDYNIDGYFACYLKKAK